MFSTTNSPHFAGIDQSFITVLLTDWSGKDAKQTESNICQKTLLIFTFNTFPYTDDPGI
jgi:hypothetical protein